MRTAKFFVGLPFVLLIPILIALVCFPFAVKDYIDQNEDLPLDRDFWPWQRRFWRA